MYQGALAGGDTGRVSPWWLIGAYSVITLGELMLSPMGLSLVSKVAPIRFRGLMMGGWFAATAIGNYLVGTIGVKWTVWTHSKFFLVVAIMSAAVGVILLFLLKPLKRAMPGV
jgi:proton-dependent oligopeptide transporter, POT family